MKISLDLTGPSNKKMWEFDMKYHDLPEPYMWEIAGPAAAFANYIATLAGGAASGDPAYRIAFAYKGDAGQPSGEGKASNLLYSQAVEVQEAGAKLLLQLLVGAKLEIASGQRK